MGWGGGGQVNCFPLSKGEGRDRKSFHFLYPHPILNDQTLIPLNFEDLVLLSPSEIKRIKLCELMISISQGIDRYKVPVVGKNGKLNDTIEVNALWSSTQ